MIANEAFEPARSARSAKVHVGADCCKRIDKTTKTPLKGVLSCLLHVHALTLYGVWGECVHFCKGVRDCVRFVGTACRSGCKMRSWAYKWA